MVSEGVQCCQQFVENGSTQFTQLQTQVTSFQDTFKSLMAASGSEIKRELAGLSALIQKQQQQVHSRFRCINAFIYFERAVRCFHPDSSDTRWTMLQLEVMGKIITEFVEVSASSTQTFAKAHVSSIASVKAAVVTTITEATSRIAQHSTQVDQFAKVST